MTEANKLQYWLMKAEPESRIEKGKDVKFSVDDFESVKTTPWEGVRNYEARNLIKQMQVGDKVLFYHSNCKTPGIVAFAEVSNEAYPDYTAWDPEHPYHDPKTNKDEPKWYMVDVTFNSRAKNFIPLSFLRGIAASSATEPPAEIGYIGKEGVQAIKEMPLLNRGRLSIQRVDQKAWSIIELLADKGGWDAPGSGVKTKHSTNKTKTIARESNSQGTDKKHSGVKTTRKRKAAEGRREDTIDAPPLRRSTRARK